ncbi:MFS transporter [Sphingomonas sp. LB-2]|uniref:MFS transporter n=1 Tax=Sphingomonas caeni TaxID=2984949 RepID=UPI00222F34D1|nr:MFS transporter [Sphingomonas caeni]MCW3848788.1 MFS transporter [Sphingomonas caeni]
MMATMARPAVPILSLVLLVAAAILLNYVDRGTIAVAAPLMKGELGLSATGFGLAVSAFFWVYAPIQLAVGWLCDRFSVYRLLAAGLAVWALSTAAMGFVGSLTGLVVLRLLLGLGESIAFPGASKIICRHVPPARRGIANSAVAAALALGPAVGTLAGGVLMINFGWRAMFMVCGLATLLWFLPWLGLMRRLPPEHRHASGQFPIGRLIGTRAIWTTSLSHFTANYSLYFLLSWLPLYLVQQRGFSIATMTLVATVSYLAQAASAVTTGWVCDRLIAGGGHEGRIFRTFSVIGIGLVGVAILGIALANDTEALVAFLILAGIGCGPCSVTLYAVAQIFAGPRAAGTYVGVQNACGNMAGIIAPIITGMIVDRTGSFLNAFYVATAVCGIGVVCWAVLVPKIAPLELD